jgi:methyl halide transferase
MPSKPDSPAAVVGPDANFWQARFDASFTPWDRGEVNPQVEEWLNAGRLQPVQQADPVAAGDQPARLTRVLVPGCGSGHEVALLAQRGFDVTGVDYAGAAVERTRERLRGLLQTQAGAGVVRAEVVQADLLTYEPAFQFDVIYEQTCLCAIYPDHWRRYTDRLYNWLRPGGSLFALFLQVHRESARNGTIQGPPYHCDINGMRALFPADRWHWPKPAYPVIAHPSGATELAVALTRR